MNLAKNTILTSAITKEVSKFPLNRKLRAFLSHTFIKPVAAFYAAVMAYISVKKFSISLSPFLLLLFPLFLSLLIHPRQYNNRSEDSRISDEKPEHAIHPSAAFHLK